MVDLYYYPEYYEIIFGNRNFKKECKFIAELIKKHSKIKVNSILDIACGTGPHIIELSKLDFKIAGLDISDKMLSIVDKNLKGNSNYLGTYKRDMASFSIPSKFDSCICMVNSLEILTKNKQFTSHFNSVANCLNPGGLYIIELDNPSFISKSEEIKEYKKSFKKGKININLIYKKYPFDFVNSLEKNELIVEINDNGKILKIVDNSPVRRLTLSDIESFIKLNNKFEIVDILGDFKFGSTINDKDSKKMIVILRRK